MSPNINSFVGDLVAMAQATEELPKVQAQLEEANRLLNVKTDHILDLEHNLSTYKTQVEELQAKVRSLEVERDNASFRVLEVEDEASRVLRMVRDAVDQLSKAGDVLDPPKAEPVEVAPPMTEPVSTTPESNPATEQPVSFSDNGGSLSQSLNPAPSEVGTQTPGESSPTSPEPAPKGKYDGLWYKQCPDYVSYPDWIENGGTYDTYYGWPPSEAKSST